jgi:hypothetical protein
MNIIESGGLGKRYGRSWALRDHTLGIPRRARGRLVGLASLRAGGAEEPGPFRPKDLDLSGQRRVGIAGLWAGTVSALHVARAGPDVRRLLLKVI